MNTSPLNHSAEDDAVRRAYQATREATYEAVAATEFPVEPPAGIDDAIRAAARRAVHARPQAAGKSWLTRNRTPLSAAAVVMLSASLLMVAYNERTDLRPDSSIAAVASKDSAARANVTDKVMLEKIPFVQTPAQASSKTDAESAHLAAAPQQLVPKEKKPSAADARAIKQVAPSLAGTVSPLASPPVIEQKTSNLRASSTSPAARATDQVVAEASSAPPPPKLTKKEVAAYAPPPEARVTISAERAFSPPVIAAPSSTSAPPPAPAMVAAAPPPSPAASAAAPAEASTALTPAKPESGRREQDTVSGETRIANKPAVVVTDQPTQSGWVTRMTALKRAGKDAELRLALRQFRKTYPDAELPKELADFEVLSLAPEAAKPGENK